MFGLIPWRRTELVADPFASTLGMAERLFNEFIPSVWTDGGDLYPTFDITETDDHILVKADLPGIDAKELDINISDNVLTVRGERKEEHEETKGKCYCAERRFGSFTRSIMLPGTVDAGAIEAHYKDGVLELNIPKMESAKQKKIEVKVMH
ncbi:MAG: Hsp20/alpha crystallin family protein [Syntrophobacteraceae bacterium]